MIHSINFLKVSFGLYQVACAAFAQVFIHCFVNCLTTVLQVLVSIIGITIVVNIIVFFTNWVKLFFLRLNCVSLTFEYERFFTSFESSTCSFYQVSFFHKLIKISSFVVVFQHKSHHRTLSDKWNVCFVEFFKSIFVMRNLVNNRIQLFIMVQRNFLGAQWLILFFEPSNLTVRECFIKFNRLVGGLACLETKTLTHATLNVTPQVNSHGRVSTLRVFESQFFFNFVTNQRAVLQCLTDCNPKAFCRSPISTNSFFDCFFNSTESFERFLYSLITFTSRRLLYIFSRLRLFLCRIFLRLNFVCINKVFFTLTSAQLLFIGVTSFIAWTLLSCFVNRLFFVFVFANTWLFTTGFAHFFHIDLSFFNSLFANRSMNRNHIRNLTSLTGNFNLTAHVFNFKTFLFSKANNLLFFPIIHKVRQNFFCFFNSLFSDQIRYVSSTLTGHCRKCCFHKFIV